MGSRKASLSIDWVKSLEGIDCCSEGSVLEGKSRGMHGCGSDGGKCGSLDATNTD